MHLLQVSLLQACCTREVATCWRIQIARELPAHTRICTGMQARGTAGPIIGVIAMDASYSPKDIRTNTGNANIGCTAPCQKVWRSAVAWEIRRGQIQHRRHGGLGSICDLGAKVAKY